MAFTYDLATNRGKTRLLLGDTTEATPIFQDDEIDAFLAMEDGIKRAAALGLETMASTEAYVQKTIQILHLKTDGSSTARALLSRAQQLREQAANEELQEEGAFDIA